MNRTAQLWTAVLAGPVFWIISLLANFALAPWACALGWKPWLYFVTVIALAATSVAGAFSWKLWRAAGVESAGEMGGAVANQRALASAGLFLSGLFFLVIVAQAIPNLVLGACQ